MNQHLLHPNKDNSKYIHKVLPADHGWDYLEFNAISLNPNETFEYITDGKEAALVPLSGTIDIQVDSNAYKLSRESVFMAMPEVLYIAPNSELRVTADSECEFAIGSAPAQGKYETKLFKPTQMKQEVRGELPAQRQVNHILAHPLPAERLILFEVYIPGGAWSGWPPHCHDEFDSSPYLEETYYYKFEPAHSGFGIHRNYRTDEDFNEVYSVSHNDLVVVTKGFHPTIAAPGSKMYFLNYLAGKLYDEDRKTPPVDDKDWAFMKEDKWGHNRFSFPYFNPDGTKK